MSVEHIRAEAKMVIELEVNQEQFEHLKLALTHTGLLDEYAEFVDNSKSVLRKRRLEYGDNRSGWE